jgi:hypothetical protein
MDLAITHPDFVTQRLVLRTAGIFSGAKLLLNDAAVARTKGTYLVRNDSGAEATVRLKARIADPIPGVMIDDAPVSLAPPLAWYEYAWIALPLSLLFIGGALGGFTGGVAAYASGHVFRSDRSPGVKYALSGLISVGAIVFFLVVAVALRTLFR